jgi:hypothetical protein
MSAGNFKELARYDAARRALAEAYRIDEVKPIRDLAMAAQLYARQANDVALIDRATDIRMRAEIRAGEILREMAKRGERREHSQRSRGATSENMPPKLSDLGISKTQSSRWQHLAELPKDERERKIERAKKKQRSALDGTAKRERSEMKAADEARVKALKPIDMPLQMKIDIERTLYSMHQAREALIPKGG